MARLCQTNSIWQNIIQNVEVRNFNYSHPHLFPSKCSGRSGSVFPEQPVFLIRIPGPDKKGPVLSEPGLTWQLLRKTGPVANKFSLGRTSAYINSTLSGPLFHRTSKMETETRQTRPQTERRGPVPRSIEKLF